MKLDSRRPKQHWNWLKRNISVGDKALAEEVVAVGYFRSGNLDESMRSYRASLQDAMQSSNLVLQADVLVGLFYFIATATKSDRRN